MNNKKENIPRKHHYIPQFIIRNFCFDEMGFVHYYDIKRKCHLNKPTEEVFLHRDLYYDDINNSDDPAKIEKDFAKYESEISKIINGKCLKNDSFVLTTEEEASLLLFLAISAFRCEGTFRFYENLKGTKSEKYYEKYQKDGDFVNLWKKNLGYVVNCRSIEEVVYHPNIDEPFKNIMVVDSIGLSGYFIVVAERRGKEDFFLSDAYGVTHLGETKDGAMQIPLLRYYPISPSRIIIVASIGIKKVPSGPRRLNESLFSLPTMSVDQKSITINVKKIYEKDVIFINDMIYQHSKEGFVYKDIDRFLISERKDNFI